MTAADLIRICLELDQQVIHPRPSEWGKAALLVRHLARNAKDRVKQKVLGDFELIDMSPVVERAPQKLTQPILDHIYETHKQRSDP